MYIIYHRSKNRIPHVYPKKMGVSPGAADRQKAANLGGRPGHRCSDEQIDGNMEGFS